MKSRVGLLVAVLLCTAVGTAFAIRSSGPGQNTSANSLSVAIATDQSRIPTSEIPQSALALTPSDTDASPGCNGVLYVGAPDAGTLTVYGCGNDASTQFTGLGTGTRLPGCFRRVEATGTAARGLVCQSF